MLADLAYLAEVIGAIAFPEINQPSAEHAKRAQKKFGYLLD